MNNRHFSLLPTERLCCQLLTLTFSEDKWPRHQAEEEHLFLLSQANEVASAIAANLSNSALVNMATSNWQQALQSWQIRISCYLRELDDVASKMAEYDIPLVAVKNAGIARGIFPHPGAVPMGDVDVLVEKKHFRRAHQLLLEMGYQFEFRSELEEANLTEAEKSGGAEYWKILPSGEKMWLELQWRPVAGRWIRPDQEPSATELMARSIPIPGTHVRLLAPEDNLLQVALHTAKHSYVRAPGFRLHLDVERIVRAYNDLDWNLFLKRVQALQVKTAVYFSLLIPYELFETPIPDWVLKALEPPRWKTHLLTKWIQRAGLFNPHEKKFSRPGYILFTALLYDDWKGLWRSIFPQATWMQERYGFESKIALPLYYLRRIANLALHRANT